VPLKLIDLSSFSYLNVIHLSNVLNETLKQKDDIWDFYYCGLQGNAASLITWGSEISTVEETGKYRKRKFAGLWKRANGRG